MNRPRKIIMFIMFLVLVAGVAACERYDLEVQNKTGEVVDIYVDRYYEGSLAPKNYLFIRNLSEGGHYIEALDIEENLIADDNIYLDGDGKWVIHETYCSFY